MSGASRKDVEERQRLHTLVQLQAQEIEALKAEITILSRKGGKNQKSICHSRFIKSIYLYDFFFQVTFCHQLNCQSYRNSKTSKCNQQLLIWNE